MTGRALGRPRPKYAASVRPSRTRARACATRMRRSSSKKARKNSSAFTMNITKKQRRQRRAVKTRAQIRELKLARLTVHRTPRHIYAQLFDGKGEKVLAAASTEIGRASCREKV